MEGATESTLNWTLSLLILCGPFFMNLNSLGLRAAIAYLKALGLSVMGPAMYSSKSSVEIILSSRDFSSWQELPLSSRISLMFYLAFFLNLSSNDSS